MRAPLQAAKEERFGLFRSREVIYWWNHLAPRVFVGTTHLRAAKWPLPNFGSRKSDNKFRFAVRATPSAFNLTGRNLVTLVSDKRRGTKTRRRKARPIPDERRYFFEIPRRSSKMENDSSNLLSNVC